MRPGTPPPESRAPGAPVIAPASGAAAGGVGEWCAKGAAELGLEIIPAQKRQLEKYYRLVVEKNKEFNLTAVTAEKEFAVKHLVDSLSPLLTGVMSGAPRVADVGAGAGLPGIPLKIVRPAISLTLIEAALKKAAFLEEAVFELGLTGTAVLRGRAEELAHRAELREQFDTALCRAVAPLPVLLEYCLGFVRPGGFLVALKGPASAGEEAAAEKALALLGGAIREGKEIILPFLGHRRRLIVVEKKTPTPAKYPRRTGIPAKRPLV